MQISRVYLENVKSYQQETIDFGQGVNAICGSNGAGKSTILEVVGATLFGYVPYKQEDFIREGEKYALMAVNLISSLDDREYRVERRIGKGAAWFVYDPEAKYRPAEGKDDVVKWLKDHMGLEEDADLKSIFCDTVGVTQGTLTAPFLEPPTDRRPKFDRLLRVEEYRQAFERLLPTRNLLSDRTVELDRDLFGLQARLTTLPELERKVEDSKSEGLRAYKRLEEIRESLSQVEGHRKRLEELRSAVEVSQAALGRRETALAAARERLISAARDLERAEESAHLVVDSEGKYREYIAAGQRLEQLDKQRAGRDEILQRRARLESQLARAKSELEQAVRRLDETSAAAERARELEPRARLQLELEREAEALRLLSGELSRLRSELPAQEAHLAQDRQAKSALERSIAEVEALRPLANDLPEAGAALREAQKHVEQVAQQEAVLARIETELAQAKSLAQKLHADVARVDAEIKRISALAAHAEKATGLETELRSLQEHRGEAQGAAQEAANALKQATGGLCPFLKEECRNLRDGVRLDTYFEARRKEAIGRLAEIDQQIRATVASLNDARRQAKEMERLPDLESQRRRSVEEEDRQSTRAGGLEEQKAAAAGLAETRRAAEADRRKLEVRLAECQRADARVKGLPEMVANLEALSDRIARDTERLSSDRARAKELADTPSKLDAVAGKLAELGNARDAYQVALATAAQAGDAGSRLQSCREAVGSVETGLAGIEAALAQYADLDDQIERQRKAQQATQDGYQTYLRNVELAGALEERRRVVEAFRSEADAAEAERNEAERARAAAAQAYDPAAHDDASRQVEQLMTAEGELRATVSNLEKQLESQKKELDDLYRVRDQARDLELKRKDMEDLAAFIEYVRGLIRSAGPRVTAAYLGRISASASMINADIMGTSTADLEWAEDYEIIARYRGQERTFKQLSGGEQMAAALAIRLALLRELSEVDVAFFDEPTQNMDQERRENLATHMPRLKGFSQLFVISHDDSFEETTDQVIRIKKVDGRSTRIEHEEAYAVRS